MEKPIKLIGKRVSGAEHHVWMDEMRKLAHKIPNSLGQLWQKMDLAHAQRDLEVLQDYEVPIVPTRLHGEVEVVFVDKTRQNARVVLEQPLLEQSHPVFYRDLMYFEKIRAFLLEMVRKGEAIYKEKDLGLDLLGGKAFKLVFPALNPFKQKMKAEVSNLLIADQVIKTPEAWRLDDRRKSQNLISPGFERRKSNDIVTKGDIRLCDVRLFDFDRGEGWYGRNLVAVLRRIHEFQYATLWALLETFGVKPEIDFETRLQLMVRHLVRHATPKMRAYAEASG